MTYCGTKRLPEDPDAPPVGDMPQRRCYDCGVDVIPRIEDWGRDSREHTQTLVCQLCGEWLGEAAR